MDNFSIIYKILKKLEKAMDLDEFSIDDVSAEILKISESRWAAIIEMLCENGYIAGVTVQRSADGEIQISESNAQKPYVMIWMRTILRLLTKHLGVRNGIEKLMEARS